MQARRHVAGLALAVGGLFLGCGMASAGSWDRFRGPNGTGVAADKDVPVRWTAEDGVLWRVPVPGVGHSSPVVWGDRLFLQSAPADGKERWLLCLDADTGKTLWTRTTAGGTVRMHHKNSLASSTPAVDGEHVYAVFWDGEGISLGAYDPQGKPAWKTNLGGFKSEFGAALSPIVFDGRVFLNNDHDGSSAVLAFDARTGKELWQARRRAYSVGYATPFVLTSDGRSELIVASAAGVTSYDPPSGRENWHFTWPFENKPLRTVASPVATAGLVIVNSGDGLGARHTIAVRLGGKGDVSATNLAWQSTNRRTLPYVPCFLARGNYLYSMGDKGLAVCRVARTGEEVWTHDFRKPVSSSPVFIDGKVYAACEDGTVYVFAADTTFQLLARNTVGEPVSATPAVANGRLYIRGREHLFCIGKPSAKRGDRQGPN
jgi:outer membrane protein assembly factor BamB